MMWVKLPIFRIIPLLSRGTVPRIADTAVQKNHMEGGAPRSTYRERNGDKFCD